MSEFLKINVNEYTEKKNGLTYLSWAGAWAEVLKIDPTARWVVHEYNGLPLMYLRDDSAIVKVSVEIKGDVKTCVLPVMNHRNQAIKNPDSFQTNTAIMRCLAKAIACHGLGLYLYQGHDSPNEESPPARPIDQAIIDRVNGAKSVGDLKKIFGSLSPETRLLTMDLFANRKKELA